MMDPEKREMRWCTSVVLHALFPHKHPPVYEPEPAPGVLAWLLGVVREDAGKPGAHPLDRVLVDTLETRAMSAHDNRRA